METDRHIIKAVISGVEGYEITFCDILSIFRTENKSYSVVFNPTLVEQEKVYEDFFDVDEAIDLFIELRKKYHIGFDLENV